MLLAQVHTVIKEGINGARYSFYYCSSCLGSLHGLQSPVYPVPEFHASGMRLIQAP